MVTMLSVPSNNFAPGPQRLFILALHTFRDVSQKNHRVLSKICIESLAIPLSWSVMAKSESLLEWESDEDYIDMEGLCHFKNAI